MFKYALHQSENMENEESTLSYKDGSKGFKLKASLPTNINKTTFHSHIIFFYISSVQKVPVISLFSFVQADFFLPQIDLDSKLICLTNVY